MQFEKNIEKANARFKWLYIDRYSVPVYEFRNPQDNSSEERHALRNFNAIM